MAAKTRFGCLLFTVHVNMGTTRNSVDVVDSTFSDIYCDPIALGQTPQAISEQVDAIVASSMHPSAKRIHA